MAARAGEVAAVAVGAGATGGPTVKAVLGPPAVGAPGVELMSGGGECRCTRDQKE